jgi:hypothetical protein
MNTQRPNEKLDWTLNYAASSGWVVGDVIVSSTWTVPVGLTQPTAASFTNTTATVWLFGPAGPYALTNLVVTSQGRTFEGTLNLTIQA